MYARREREEVMEKAYIYCFYPIILLFKSIQGGGSIWKTPNLSVHTLLMVPKSKTNVPVNGIQTASTNVTSTVKINSGDKK